MELTELIAPARVLLDLRARDKAQLIGDLARVAAGQTSTIPPTTIEAALLARERLGSTGLGAGFALPHARIEGLSQFLGFFIRLARPVEFDAIDGNPVDLLFLLLIPANAVDHVGALAAVSRRFRDRGLANRLRKAPNQAAAHSLLTEPVPP
jgi:PTS system nitrogen regulatory IIA component